MKKVFERLNKVYLQDRIATRLGDQLRSSWWAFWLWKKTHFLRQLWRSRPTQKFATSEVSFDKDLDYSNRLSVYKEIVRNLRMPDSSGRGMREILAACAKNVQVCCLIPMLPKQLFKAGSKG